jgi:hypothetical protein
MPAGLVRILLVVVRRRSLSVLLLALVASALPAAARADMTPAPAPQPKPARISLALAGTFRVAGKTVTTVGKRVRIDGRIAPYVPGERIVVRIWRGHLLIKQATVRPTPTHSGLTATFSVRFASVHSGPVQIFAVHAASAAQHAARTKAMPISVLLARAGPGTRDPFVALLQQRLTALGYSVSHSGAYDASTQRAVLAFRKVGGLPRVMSLSPTVVDRLLRGVGAFHVRFPGQGRHVEANLGQQVLALIDHGRVVRAYGTSSGKPSTPTVLGSYHFYSKTPGTNAEGMVDAAYFVRGYAIHGYVDVPPYNASHGCLRVWIPDARPIFDWVHVGDRIDVYY